MSHKFSQPYNKIAAALIMLSPVAAVNAAAPVFVENSVLDTKLEFLFKARTGNSEHLSMVIDNNDTVYTALQYSAKPLGATSPIDAVQVSKYAQNTVTLSGYLSANTQDDSATPPIYTHSQIKVNPVDNSLVLGFIEGGKLKIRTSIDGATWQSATVVPTLTGRTPKIFKMELDSLGNIYLIYADTTNKAEVLKFNGSSWDTVLSPISVYTTALSFSADIAIDKQDKPYLVYRNAAENNLTFIASPGSSGAWESQLTTGITGAMANTKLAFDNDDNLHLYHIGHSKHAGGTVYKLDGSEPADLSWTLVGNRNFGFALADTPGGARTVSSQTIDIVFDSNNVAYVAFQQLNNTLVSKKQMQMAKLVGNTWTEIGYVFSTVSKSGSLLDKANNNFVDLVVDAYDRPLVIFRSSGPGHDSSPYAMRLNRLPAEPSTTMPISINESSVIAGNLVVGKLTAVDDDDDAITLTLTGDDAGLFTIDQNTGEISFKVAPVIASDSTYNLTVNAAANGDTTSVNVQVTLVNDTNNDVVDVDSDGDGIADNDDAFPDDIAASIDSDDDGFPDSWNAGKTAEDSTTGLTSLDAFPNDVAASIDSDDDGFPDRWNDGQTASDSTTNLTLDAFPNDDTKSVNTAPVITAPANIINVVATDASGTANTDAAIVEFLSGATATDVDGNSTVTITHNAPATFPLNETVVTFTATDSLGLTHTAQATVRVSDLTAPVITLVGIAEVIPVGDEYVELGATAFDNVDGNTLTVIADSSAVDTSTPGNYVVTYNVMDTAENSAIEVIRNISVADVVKPVLITPPDITIDATNANGTAATNAEITAFLIAATATDNIDVDVTVEVTINDAAAEQIDVFPMGPTIVTFTTTDSANNTSTTTAIITIADLSAPVITLSGGDSITVPLNGTYSEAGYENASGQYIELGIESIIDNVDGDITDIAEVGTVSTVDLSTEDTYTVTYTVLDEAGKSGSAIRTVIVQDASAPVVSAPDSIIVEATSPAGTENSDPSIATFLLAAKAEDAVDGPLVANAVNVPSVFALGDNVVTFESTDSEYYTGTGEATITVVDTTKPVIKLTGKSSVTIALGSVYSDAGATVTDIYDTSVTVAVAGVDAIDTSVETTYTITYSAVDIENNTADTVTRTVTVQNEQAPTVTPPDNITVAAINANGTPFTDSAFDAFFAGARAVDFSDTTLEVTNDAEGIVPLNTPTTVTFTATDGDLEGTATATVTVTDQTAPVITLTAAAGDIYVGDNYVEPGVSASDNVDGDISGNINVSGAVDTTLAGTYTLTYDVSDVAGIDAVQVTRQVVVLNLPDRDGDGVPDADDAFPDDAEETLDTDGDGVGNNADDFPNDGNETVDTDGDGVGNNADNFPNDNTETIDSDGDGVGNNADIFPNDANETLDTDGDSVGNNADDFPNDGTETVDTDGDGVGDNGDVFPTDSNESADTDGDGFGDTMDPNPNDANDGTAPVFAQEIATIKMDATATLTDISAAIAASGITALDMFDGAVIAELASTELIYASGNHVITLSATDLAGNKSTAEVYLAINPVVQLGASLTAETGGQLTIPVALSGPAATYPVVLDYTVTNLAEEETKGQLTLEEGAVMAELLIDISADVQQGVELVIQFTQATNAVVTELTKVNAVINNENYAPTLKVNISQAGQPVSVISPSLGLVTLTAAVTDLNSADEHNISFEVIGGEFIDDGIDEAPNTLVFDPLNLETGSYPVKVNVTEINTDAQLSSELTVQVNVDTELTDLVADSDQDGIPDSVDTSGDTTRLPIAEDEQPLQVLPGLTLSIGDLAAGGDSATIDADVVSSDIHFNALSTITNFNVGGLTISGSSVAVVLPLAKDVTIPSNAIYRKYSEAKGWFTFVEDENNSLSSALKDDNGNCPAPSSSAYLTEGTLLANGLIEGKNCIQLTIEDGGANDADETANGTVVDPGVLVSEFENTLPEISLSNTAATSRQAVNLQAVVTDAEGDELSYTWEQIDGLSVDIGTASSDTLSFTAPEVVEGTDLRFKLTVHDGRASTSEEVKVTVTPESVIDTDPRGGSFGWLLSLVALIGLGRRKLSK